MPKDDWAKYARRDRGRKAIASGDYDSEMKERRLRKREAAKVRRKKKAHTVQRRGTIAVKAYGFTICYAGEPETARVRYIIKGDMTKPHPPWPGFN